MSSYVNPSNADAKPTALLRQKSSGKKGNAFHSPKSKKKNNATSANNSKLFKKQIFNDSFFNIINKDIATKSKFDAKKAISKDIDEKLIEDGITEQHKLTTQKIIEMIASDALTPLNIYKHKLSNFNKIVLVDFENLWNVNFNNLLTVSNIINTIYDNETETENTILFVFIIAKYHRDNKLFAILEKELTPALVREYIYIDCNIDNPEEISCFDKYKFNETDDYLLLKMFKFLKHFNIHVEILSADQYNYSKNQVGIIDYIYLNDEKHKQIKSMSIFNPVEYYNQFLTLVAKPIKVSKPDSVIAHPDILKRTQERVSSIDKNIVYYNNGSQFNKVTGDIFYYDGINGKLTKNGIVFNSGAVELHDGSIKDVDGTIYHMDGKITYTNGNIEFPDGAYKYADGTVEYPYGKIKNRNGRCQYPDDSMVDTIGTRFYATGEIEYPDGLIQYPDGHVEQEKNY